MPPKPKFRYIEPQDVVPGDIIKWDNYPEIYTVTGLGEGDTMLLQFSGGNAHFNTSYTPGPGEIQWRGRDEKIYEEWRAQEKEKERKELESYRLHETKRRICLS